MRVVTENQITRLEISKEAIRHNLDFYKSVLAKTTKILVMVKAFSYGNGGVGFSQYLERLGVDYLGVAISGEGVALRKAGVKLPIIVMSPHAGNCAEIIEYQLEPEIYNFKILKEFNTALLGGGKKGYPVHIKFDTGMNRLGFRAAETEQVVKQLKGAETIKVKSIFSHLAGADSVDYDDFTKKQIKLFTTIYKQFSVLIGYMPMWHILNSAGAERFPAAAFDMVRLGIGLYGFSSNFQHKLKNVSTFKSKILQIKTILPGETVGYSRNGEFPNGGKIAVISAGYGDGIGRGLGNGKLSVEINGQLAPLTGNVCMDMCMADISKIDAEEGDDVIFFGDRNTASDIAEASNTISYEIITKIPGRVKRILV